jgi:hypothetical protein
VVTEFGDQNMREQPAIGRAAIDLPVGLSVLCDAATAGSRVGRQVFPEPLKSLDKFSFGAPATYIFVCKRSSTLTFHLVR